MTLLLVHTAHPQALQHRGPGFGRLLSPRQYARVTDTAEAGIPWAADNDCFQRLDAKRYKAMLRAIKGVPGCLFVSAPDVVGDARATAERWAQWYPILSWCEQPIAYVAQDGCTVKSFPWEYADALFIGGTTEYKLGEDAKRLSLEARWRGMYVHMGRVNSWKRFKYANDIGCHSVDGTKFSRWRNTWLPEALTWHTKTRW